MLNDLIQNTLLQEISNLAPDYHITLTWDNNHRTKDLLKLESLVRDFMAPFENKIAGGRNWFRHHYRFMMFVERHRDDTLHTHILLASRGKTKSELEQVFYTMRRHAFANYPIPYITDIYDKTPEYVMKQIKPQSDGTIDTGHWITSEYLFNLPHKKKRHRKAKGIEKYNTKINNPILCAENIIKK